MNIILSSDPRYPLIQLLWSKYRYDNLHKRFIPNTGDYFYIPPELVIQSKEYTTFGVYTMSDHPDPDWDNWVYTNSMSRVLLECCQITKQDYYDLLILHINDHESRPKCKYCGSYLGFTGELKNGYSHHQIHDLNANLFCSTSCRQLYIYDHPEEYPHLESKVSKWIDKVSTDPIIQFKASYYSIESKCNLKALDPLDFYIAEVNGKIKFGISIDGYYRLRHEHPTYIKVWTLESYKSRLLEYVLKLYLWNTLKHDSEYLDKSMISNFKCGIKLLVPKVMNLSISKWEDLDKLIQSNTFALNMI